MTRTGSAAASVRLTFGRLVAYSTNQLPLNMAALPVVLNVSHFYGEVLKVPLGIMGLIFIAARVIDAIQDPVIGLISDKFTHRGPRGRLTFVALMLPLMIGGFYMLFHPPEALFVQTGVAWIVLVDDADLKARTLNKFLWVTFTRMTPAVDMDGVGAFVEHKHWGCRGPLVIDARRRECHQV